MLRLLAALAWASVGSASAVALAGGISLLGVGTPPSSAAGYQGAGDIIASGWKAFYSTQAFTAANRGANVMNVCIALDAACADLATDGTTGLLLIGTLVGGSACNVVTCTVKTWYDQSGNSIDVTQATEANRPVLAVGPNGLYCPSVTDNTQTLVSSGTITQSQPITIIALGTRTSDTSTAAAFIVGGANTLTLGSGATTNNWRLANGAFLNEADNAATDSAFHSGLGLASSGSSKIYIDGTLALTGNAGSSGFSGAARVFGASVVDRKVCEAGIIGGDQSANAAALNTNQKLAGRFGSFP